MKKLTNTILHGAANRRFALDVIYTENNTPKPVVIFAHGFKGFKDWGHWEAIGEAFARAGFMFVKFNFSHNGVSPEKPLDFVDLEAFGQNNYMKEIVDFGVLMDWLFEQKDIPETEIDLSRITAIGHSRGGPIAILKGLRDARITSVITWASVHQLDYWHNDDLIEKWREDGVWYILNGRTKQQMPLYFQLYENMMENKDWLDVKQHSPNSISRCLFCMAMRILPFLFLLPNSYIHGKKMLKYTSSKARITSLVAAILFRKSNSPNTVKFL